MRANCAAVEALTELNPEQQYACNTRTTLPLGLLCLLLPAAAGCVAGLRGNRWQVLPPHLKHPHGNVLATLFQHPHSAVLLFVAVANLASKWKRAPLLPPW